MKEQLAKLQQTALRADFSAVRAVPHHFKADATNLQFVCKPVAEAAAGSPILEVERLLAEQGLAAESLRYFPAAKSPAVIAVNVTSVPQPAKTPKEKPLTPNP